MRILIGTSVLWLGLSAISDGVSTLVLPVRLGIDANDASASVLGLITFVGLLAAMLVQPIAGDVSDRIRGRVGRRTVIGLGVGLTAIGLLGLVVADSPVGVGLAFLWLSVALSITQAPQQALLPELVPTERRGRAAGLKGFADLLGAAIGFAVLGVLLSGGDVRPALVFLAIALVSLYGLVLILLGRPTRSDAAPPVVRRPARGLIAAYRLDLDRDGAFVRAVIARFAFLLGVYGIGRFFVAIVADRLQLDAGPAAEAAGGVLAILALVTAIGALPAGVLADRWQRAPLMAGGAVASIAGVATLAVGSDLATISVAGILLAIGSALFGVANWATLVDLAPRDEAARYLGIANFGTAGASAAAGLFGLVIDGGNALAPGMGFTALFAATSVAFVVGGWLSPLRTRQVPAPSPVS